MYWIYILENLNDKSWYIGYTSDLERRIKEHQEGKGARTTKIKKDWHLIIIVVKWNSPHDSFYD